MKNSKDVYYVGVNDHKVDLFEGHYIVPNGMAYNSYVIMDEKIVIMDTVDRNFTKEWLMNIKNVLGERKPDYLVVQHMEPDHSANIMKFLEVYPDATIVSNVKAFKMMDQFFHAEIKNKLIVKEGDTLNLGKHVLNFVFAPMVHWPEVMFTYDSTDKILWSADAFGKFGALDVEDDWDCEARRYYIGIVGKYGPQVQNVLAKAKTLEIKSICPLHGPILEENLSHYLNKYDIWSSYQTESEGIAIFFTSVYGNTKAAVELLTEKLKAAGCPKVVVNDLARTDMAEDVEDAFRYGKIILATTTYNASIFPYMNEFLTQLTERNFQNKTIALMENGSWAPMAAKVMKDKLAASKNITIVEPTMKILSSMDESTKEQMDAVVKHLCSDYANQKEETADTNNLEALFNIGYGLYVVTTNDGKKDNGIILNAVTQLTDSPAKIAVTVSKLNYSHDVIKNTKKLNVNCLTTNVPLSVIERFGFQSGKDVDKFEGFEALKSKNGLPFLKQYINSFMSLDVVDTIDLGTHSSFICTVSEARVINEEPSVTYAYYQEHIKTKPEAKKKGYVCKVCGYVHEGDELPEDFICPLCKHGAADFEKIE